MRRSLPLALTLLVASFLFPAACHDQKPSNTIAADTARTARTPENRAADRVQTELLAWLTVDDPEHTLSSLLGTAGSQAKEEILKSLGVSPTVAATVDTRRPLVVAMVDPRTHTVRPRAP